MSDLSPMAEVSDSLQVLLVEDDEELSDLLVGRLEKEGYDSLHVSSGERALDVVDDRQPDLVLLDVMLPELNGLEVCRRLRAEYPLMYIIMVTAKTEETDRVVGLEVGADDYITKPFSLQELMARVRSVMRRQRRLREERGGNGDGTEDPSEEVVSYEEIRIDPVRHEVECRGESVDLTVREFELLHYLARSPGRAFTRAQILEDVWEIDFEGYSRTIDSHVQRLRKKLERDPSNPELIQTVWGVGYKFQPLEIREQR